MTDPLVHEDDGGTELSEEDREGLIPSYFTLPSELNVTRKRYIAVLQAADGHDIGPLLDFVRS